MPRLSPLGRWLAGVAAAVATVVLTAWMLAWGLIPQSQPQPQPSTTSQPQPRPPTTAGDDVPFTVAVRAEQDVAFGWISDKPLSQIPARPSHDGDWEGWARRTGAVPADTLTVFFTVQGKTAAQVTLTDLRVRVVQRRPPLPGTRFVVAGGGPTTYRWVRADLDKEPPTLSSGTDELLERYTPAHERRPIRFPYRVALSDAETFAVEGWADECDCSWIIELSWASQGRVGKTIIDNGGAPFRVTGTGNATRRCESLHGEQCYNT